MDVKIEVTNDILSQSFAGLEMMASKVLPKTYKAFKAVSNMIAFTWKSYALGAPIPGQARKIKHPTGGYARSIKVRMLAPFHYTIFSDSPIADYLERGTKQYDMKKTHPYGNKSRVVKKTVKRHGRVIRKAGDPYLIIPLRHGIPTSLRAPMPEEVYNKVRQLIKAGEATVSNIAKKKIKQVNARGELIPRNTYSWGSRFVNTGMDNLENMVVMRVPSGQKEIRSAYFTFRVISVNSPASHWIQPARQGLHLTEAVMRTMKPIMTEMLQGAIKQDLGI